jgi:hypothetical protein
VFLVVQCAFECASNCEVFLLNTKNSFGTATKVPPPTVHPLDNNDELVRLLSDTTGESRDVVIQRLIDEEACLGTNVRRDLKNAGCKAACVVGSTG